MAPNLANYTFSVIHDMINSGKLNTSQMADCSKRAITRIRSNLRLFDSVKAPLIKGGWPRSIALIILGALCDHLLEKPYLYLYEMELFFLDEFNVSIPKSTISDALRHEGWYKDSLTKGKRACIHDTQCGYCSWVVYQPCNRRLNASLSDPPQSGCLSLLSCDVLTCIPDVIINLMPQIARNV